MSVRSHAIWCARCMCVCLCSTKVYVYVCMYSTLLLNERAARRSYHITFKMRLRLPGKELLMVS